MNPLRNNIVLSSLCEELELKNFLSKITSKQPIFLYTIKNCWNKYTENYNEFALPQGPTNHKISCLRSFLYYATIENIKTFYKVRSALFNLSKAGLLFSLGWLTRNHNRMNNSRNLWNTNIFKTSQLAFNCIKAFGYLYSLVNQMKGLFYVDCAALEEIIYQYQQSGYQKKEKLSEFFISLFKNQLNLRGFEKNTLAPLLFNVIHNPSYSKTDIVNFYRNLASLIPENADNIDAVLSFLKSLLEDNEENNLDNFIYGLRLKKQDLSEEEICKVIKSLLPIIDSNTKIDRVSSQKLFDELLSLSPREKITDFCETIKHKEEDFVSSQISGLLKEKKKLIEEKKEIETIWSEFNKIVTLQKNKGIELDYKKIFSEIFSDMVNRMYKMTTWNSDTKENIEKEKTYIKSFVANNIEQFELYLKYIKPINITSQLSNEKFRLYLELINEIVEAIPSLHEAYASFLKNLKVEIKITPFYLTGMQVNNREEQEAKNQQKICRQQMTEAIGKCKVKAFKFLSTSVNGLNFTKYFQFLSEDGKKKVIRSMIVIKRWQKNNKAIFPKPVQMQIMAMRLTSADFSW